MSGNTGIGLDLHEILSTVTTVRLYLKATILFISHSELLQLLGKKLCPFTCPAHETVPVLSAFHLCTYRVKYFTLITLDTYS